ncbi:hypothetical protein QVD17_14686 [Tagetes erecta]|uniref:Uncharacterized protein n=1 Tax=Tagetes erecta TaxID=13708 RepID=A0AAD8NYX6_TARER|nr:hypothetical protein QVD17_14686 [Tagetes erecta]
MAIHDLVHDTKPMQYGKYLEEGYAQNEVDDHIIGAFLDCLEEIDVKGKELLKKIVSKDGHVEISLGKLAREAIGDSRGKDFVGKIVTKVSSKMKLGQRVDDHDEDFVVSKRDLSIDDELMSHKLERFKVKTVNIGGVVVKEDQKY